MGLDQQAYIKDENEDQVEIQYWRKHNALDGWMQSLWRAKGNKGEFNCAEVELTANDLDQLEKVVTSEKLPETIGFFYGCDSRQSAYQKKETLKFIIEARYQIEEQKEKVFYSCWW